jgi:hypothetical protein
LPRGAGRCVLDVGFPASKAQFVLYVSSKNEQHFQKMRAQTIAGKRTDRGEIATIYSALRAPDAYLHIRNRAPCAGYSLRAIKRPA